MPYTVSTLKADLTRKLHGTALSKLQSPLSLFGEAGRNIATEIDPPETKQLAELTLYDGIYDYSPPSDLKGNKIIDLRPQAPRAHSDNFTQKLNEEFDIYKSNQDFTIEFDNGTKVLRVSKSLTGNQLVEGLDSLTANGTWSAAGGATSLAVDTIYKTQGSASLKFNVGASGGYIENSTFTAVDLTDHDEVSSLFVRVYVPTTTGLTNMILRWGNDSSNYWSKTVTAPHFGSSFKTGWQWVRFDWSSATETGTVAPASIDYLRLTITTSASATAYRVDEIRSVLPHIYECLYYSRFLFRSSAGTFLETPTATDDTDIINLETDGYNLLLYETCRLVAQEIQGEDSAFDAAFFKQELYGDGSANKPGMYKRYKKSYPSETIKSQSTYYRMPSRTYDVGGTTSLT